MTLLKTMTLEIQTKLQKLPSPHIWSNASQHLFVKELQTNLIQQQLDAFSDKLFNDEYDVEDVLMVSKQLILCIKIIFHKQKAKVPTHTNQKTCNCAMV